MNTVSESYADGGSVDLGMTGKLTVVSDLWFGIYAVKSINVTGSGDIEITADGIGLDSDDGNVTIGGSGSLTLTTEDRGIYADGVLGNADIGNITITGSRSVTVNAGIEALRACSAITLSGSGAVNVTSTADNGIYSEEGDVTLSGSGAVTVTGGLNAVKLCTAEKKLKLTGTNSPVKLTCGEDSLLVADSTDALGTVANPNVYRVTDGVFSEDSTTVTWELKNSIPALHIGGKDYSLANLEKNITGTNWSWNAAERIITLDGYNGGRIESQKAFGKLNICVAGNSTVEVSDGSGHYGIQARDDITINGNDKLTINVNNNGYDGIWAENGDLTLNMSGKLIVNAKDDGVVADGNINITGSGAVDITGGSNAIYAVKHVNITGSGAVTVASGSYISVEACGDVNITGTGAVMVTSENSLGVVASGNIKISGSGDLNVISYFGCLTANNEDTGKGNITLSGTRSVNLENTEENAVLADKNVTFGNTGDLFITSGETGIYVGTAVNLGCTGNVTINAGKDGIIVEDGAVRFTGTASPITISCGEGYKLVRNGEGDFGTIHDVNSAYKITDGAFAADSDTVTYEIVKLVVVFDPNGGTVDPTSSVVDANGKVTLPTPTRTNYTFDGWFTAATGGTQVDANKVYTENTKIYAHWKRNEPVTPPTPHKPSKPSVTPVNPTEPELPFKDVKKTDWSYEDIKYVYFNDLMTGTAADLFSPQLTTSRAMIVTILWRMETEPVVNYAMSFKDVKSDEWYTEAIRWAQANKIVEGYSTEEFRPEALITREQLAAILYRYATYKKMDTTISEDTNFLSFNDFLDVSEYAKTPMMWALEKSLIKGEGMNLNPQLNALREQTAVIFHRFCEAFVRYS